MGAFRWTVDCCENCLCRIRCHFEGCIYDDIAHINLRGVLTEREKLIVMLLGAEDAKPIPSMLHLEAEVFLVENVLMHHNYPSTKEGS